MRKNTLIRFVSLFMCAVLAVSFCSCNIADQIRYSVHERITIQSDISIQEMTRLIINSINDKRTTADSYSKIPENQLDGLSYSYFYEYLNILRTVSTQDNNGKIVSFRIISDEECTNLLGSGAASRYGQIKGAQLLFSSDVEYPIYIFFSVNDEGEVYLSKDWVTSIINIYNYSNHYFTLLDESNADAVKALLFPGLTGTEYTDDVVYCKAQQLCEFYRLRVMSNRSEYEITRLVPWEMTVRIPETIASDGLLFEDHLVTISLLDNGNYFIDDKITSAPDLNLTYLVRGDERLIRIGNEYTFSQLVGAMGEPSAVNYNEDEGLVIVIYSGAILRFDDVYEFSEDWTGTLSSIRLIVSSSYSVGYNLYVGMTRSQILLSYPFADDYDYTLYVSSGSRDYQVEFGFDDDDVVQYVKVYS